jgi:hypothetical protein
LGTLRKEIKVNTYSTYKGEIATTTIDEMLVSDFDTLIANNFSATQIVSLLGLRQRYQSSGSDRAAILHHWEFLKLLVATGQMEA